ncbi:MAG: DUF2934 domain-containing protein [Gallionella sp.]|nr:DUF2934 domain-containing protein [Gallionella sp.]
MSNKIKSSKAETETNLSEEQRRRYVEVAAYHLAEKGGFKCGCDLENWLAAEAEIDQLAAENSCPVT